jgi:hypothetical protein
MVSSIKMSSAPRRPVPVMFEGLGFRELFGHASPQSRWFGFTTGSHRQTALRLLLNRLRVRLIMKMRYASRNGRPPHRSSEEQRHRKELIRLIRRSRRLEAVS